MGAYSLFTINTAATTITAILSNTTRIVGELPEKGLEVHFVTDFTASVHNN